MSTRRPDWYPRLVTYLGAAARRPFTEGELDCALFAAGAVAAMTGEDLAAPYRGRYRTTRGGLRLLRRAGYADPVALAADHLPEIAVAEARPGDLVVVPTPDGAALGILQGAAGVHVMAATGMGLVPAALVTRAFRVG